MIINKKFFFILFSLGVLILIFIKFEFFNDKNDYVIDQNIENNRDYPIIVGSGNGVIFSKGKLVKGKLKGWNPQEEDIQKAEKILFECKGNDLLKILPLLSEYLLQEQVSCKAPAPYV